MTQKISANSNLTTEVLEDTSGVIERAAKVLTAAQKLQV